MKENTRRHNRGPSYGCISDINLDIEIDYERLKTVGAMMGSGGWS